MKSFNLTEWALGHRAIVLFLILVIGIGGVLGFTSSASSKTPTFRAVDDGDRLWPGATAQQVQDELLNRWRRSSSQLDHFEKVKTYARQGYGAMTITVVGGTSEADQQEAWYQARKKFSDIKLELPDGVIGPIFNDEYGDVTGLLYAVKGDGISQWELSDIAEDVKRRLLKVPMVKKVDIYGKQAKKVYVEFSHQRLAALGITPIMIAESLSNQNAVHATGRSTRAATACWCGSAAVQESRRYPQRADRRWRPRHQARRLHDDHARLRRPADVHRPPQRPAGADDRHHDDRRRQHRRSR